MATANPTDQRASVTLERRLRRSWPRYLLALLIVAAVISFYFTGLREYFGWDSLRANVDAWQAQVAQNLVAAVVVFFFVYTIITALSLPAAAAMTLLAGALFGRVVGTAVVSGASTLGATLAFLGSRYLFRDWVQSRYGDRLRAVNEGIERDGAYYLFMLRLVPLVPFFLINLGMGLTRIGVWTYVVTSWLGMLLGTFLYVNAGTAIATINSPGDVLSLPVMFSLAALGVVPLVIRKISQLGKRG
ncbi:MAG: TVP38/TMEM64 family protein [Pirellulales bacterium]